MAEFDDLVVRTHLHFLDPPSSEQLAQRTGMDSPQHGSYTSKPGALAYVHCTAHNGPCLEDHGVVIPDPPPFRPYYRHAAGPNDPGQREAYNALCLYASNFYLPRLRGETPDAWWVRIRPRMMKGNSTQRNFITMMDVVVAAVSGASMPDPDPNLGDPTPQGNKAPAQTHACYAMISGHCSMPVQTCKCLCSACIVAKKALNTGPQTATAPPLYLTAPDHNCSLTISGVCGKLITSCKCTCKSCVSAMTAYIVKGTVSGALPVTQPNSATPNPPLTPTAFKKMAEEPVTDAQKKLGLRSTRYLPTGYDSDVD